MKVETLGCFLCRHRNTPGTTEPCVSCDTNFSNFEPADTVDTNQLVEEERRKREEAKREEAEKSPETPDEMEGFVRPTCEDCRYSMRRVEEEPCLSCYKYSEFTPLEETVDGTDANDDVIEPCNTCTHRDNLRCNPPCSHCRRERGIEYPEYEEAEQGIDCPEYEDKDSGYKGTVPQHIADMFVEDLRQAALRFVNGCNARPRPCPYCGEIPEVVEETIYPGEKHCYVVCNGAKLLPHSISVHGRTREEAVANWNSFVLTMKNQGK